MLRTYKTEINPNKEQRQKILQTIDTCRYVYNFFIAHNKEVYKRENKFVSAYDFSKWLNQHIKEHQELSWIKDVSSKSIKQSIFNAETAFKRFFKKQSNFPKFKKKNKSNVKMYFVKTDSKSIIKCQRHRIKIPTLGFVRLKEKGYIPTNYKTHIIKSGTVSYEAGRFYVSVLVDEQINYQEKIVDTTYTSGIGLDLGVKDFIIISDDGRFKNINKSSSMKRLEKSLKRQQRKLSRKYESLKKNKKEGEPTRQNISKQILKVQRLYKRMTNIRDNHINQCINTLVKTKPEYITIEDLNVSGMMKNRHLSKAIASLKLYSFVEKLKYKCHMNGIELRQVDKFYPSSKTCHRCGCVKERLNISERTYVCEHCGFIEDRDLNASLNLRDASSYRII